MSKTPGVPPDKICARCGRAIEYRRKWAGSWDQIKYCGERCRRAKPAPGYEEAILGLLDRRARGATICPSEVLPRESKGDHALMEEVRRAARRLVAAGRIEITQKGRVVDPSTVRGPIRLRKRDP